jgi:hypothetical protein
MKIPYQKRIELSLIVTLTMLILIFFLFPKFESNSPESIDIYISDIQAVQIPKTYQPEIFSHPPAVKPSIPIESEEIELMENVVFESQINDRLIVQEGLLAPLELDRLPYTPRQLYEVLPEGINEEIEGEIKLVLKINIDGTVIAYRTIYNSINNKAYRDRIIEAALRSRWDPAVINGRPVIYWVEKSYKFR